MFILIYRSTKAEGLQIMNELLILVGSITMLIINKGNTLIPDKIPKFIEFSLNDRENFIIKKKLFLIQEIPKKN